MAKVEFAHLHSHTDHSKLDGHARIDELAEYAFQLGQPGFATTDHGSMSNTYNGMMAAKRISEKYGEPFSYVPGIEAYVAPGDTPRTLREPVFFSENKASRSDDVSRNGAYTHLTMLAETTEGMHNLFRLSTLSWKDGYYHQPRMDIESIATYSKGVIATTGCPSGELQTRLRLGQWKEAMEYASKMQDIFGKENYYLELMDHNMSIDLERRIRGELMRVAKDLNIPLLATNDLHYVHKEDALAQEHLLCINSGRSMNDLPYDKGGNRFAFDGEEYYTKTTEQMLKLFPVEDYPDAIQNSAEIVKRCTAEFSYDQSLRPSVPLPDGHTEHTFLRQMSLEGLDRKRPDKANDPEYLARIDKELGILEEKNFSGYVLVVSDFMRWAKQNGIQCGPGRGSGGGSLVAFLTDIVEIDPIEHGLIFERFLNPERDSMPDFDSDFDDANRDRVIEYVRQAYGEDMVSMISTFGIFKAKQSIKDILRIYDEPFALGKTLSDALPPAVAGAEMSLKEVYDTNSERYAEAEKFREEVNKLSNRNLIPYAMGLEGHMRSVGVHAAGVLMSSKPIKDSIPLWARQDDGVDISQYDYPTCEALGLVKMDFLGLRNLQVIDKSIAAIKRNHGVDLVPQDIYDEALTNPDQNAFDLINSGRTLGVFQLDSSGITSLARMINVTSFGDISALVALYRPGPMGMESHIRYANRKNGREEVAAIHPELAESVGKILDETFGLCVYQEQIQFIAQEVAGYSLGRADILRRAMGKKKKEILDEQFVPFSEGMKKNGYSDEAITALWDTLIPFAKYGFNKSHSAAYGLLSYLTAYLKANYGPEFMAANLSTMTDDKDKTSLYLAECRKLGIKVLPPDVRHSTADYTATPEGTILVGLQAIRGVGYGVADSIFRESAENGVYKDLDDFMSRAPANALNKGVLEGLAHAGALDGFGYSRRTLYTQLPEVAGGFAQARRKQDAGQFSLFDEVEDVGVPAIDISEMPEYTKKDKLMFERHALGLYVSDHPLSGIANMLDRFSDTKIADIVAGQVRPSDGFKDRQTLRLAGVVGSLIKKPTRAGTMFSLFELEDITGTLQCIVFPKTFERIGHLLEADTIYELSGSLLAGDGEDDVKFAVDNVKLINMTETGLIPFEIHVRVSQATTEAVTALESVLRQHPGQMPVHLHVVDANNRLQVFEIAEHLRVEGSKDLAQEIRALFGASALR